MWRGLHPVRRIEHGCVRQTGGLGRQHNARIGSPGDHKPERRPGTGAALLLTPRGQPRVRFGGSQHGRTGGCVMLVAFHSMVRARGCSWREIRGDRCVVMVNRRAGRFGSSDRHRPDGTLNRAQHAHRRSCGERADHHHADRFEPPAAHGPSIACACEQASRTPANPRSAWSVAESWDGLNPDHVT
jgi:hypothetical protein